MSDERRSFEEIDQDEKPLRVGQHYEVVHGPASSPERTSTGVLVDIDLGAKAYTFELEDGSLLSVADDEIDRIRHISDD